MGCDKIVEFENRLLLHPEYSFKRYNQLKAIIIYLKSYFDNGGSLTDKQTQLDMELELENELECLKSLRYAKDKDADFVLHINTTTRIAKIMNTYMPKDDIATSTETTSVIGNLNKRLFKKNMSQSPFDQILEITSTWAK